MTEQEQYTNASNTTSQESQNQNQGGNAQGEGRSPEAQFLRRLGLKIQGELQAQGKSVDWLSGRVGVARSTICEIIAGRSNPRLLTLHFIVKGLGYDSVSAFLANV